MSEKPPGVLVENYRGCDIYWYAAGSWYAYAVYDSPCVLNMVFQDPQDLIRAIDEALVPEPPKPSFVIPIVLGLGALFLFKGKK